MKDKRYLKFAPIGLIHSRFSTQEGTPIQPNLGQPAEAEIHIHREYRQGLADLERFDYIWVISWLERSKPFRLKVVPYRDSVERGLFATRAPSRPNPIGLSAVRLLSVDQASGVIRVAAIDLLDGTPVLDIKPYIPEFDSHPAAAAGWMNEAPKTSTANGRFSDNGSSSPVQR